MRGKCGLLAAAMLLGGPVLHGSDLAGLARIAGASGDEKRVIAYIRERVGGHQRIGVNGSLVVTFGAGSPRTLLIAGVDEPGFAVSRIDERGYLWLHPLAELAGSGGLPARFRGQHVRVSTRADSALSGVVAVPSVHFRSFSGMHSQPARSDTLVDVGASGRQEAVSAGIGILDRVTLDKQLAILPGQWIASPWISSRAGAGVLMALARHLATRHPEGTVMLAFVTQQYPHNAGLARALRSIKADRTVVIAPNGGRRSSVAPASGTTSDDSRIYFDLAGDIGLSLERKASHAIDFGPFGDSRPWEAGRSVTVLHPGVRNAGTPAESVSMKELDLITSLLSITVGLPPLRTAADGNGAQDGPTGPAESAGPRSGFETTIAALVREPGVSGEEGTVRTRIRQLVDTVAAQGVRFDSKGNLIVRIGGTDAPSAAFIAHMDEIGYTIRSVLADGTVSVSSKGGGPPEVVAWQSMSVHGPNGTLPSVMKRVGHLEFGGASGEQLRALGVRVGAMVTVTKRYVKLLGSRISGRSLDDRLGCAVLIEVLKRVSHKARRADGAIEFVFSVEEETGLRGARHYMQTARPKRVYPIDTFVTSDSPFGFHHLAPARLGAGAVLRAVDQSGMTPLREVDRVLSIARRARIPVQVGVTAGGNDGSVFKYLETVNIPIGFPLRYAHSPVETADLRDAGSVADLVEALALAELGLRR